VSMYSEVTFDVVRCRQQVLKSGLAVAIELVLDVLEFFHGNLLFCLRLFDLCMDGFYLFLHIGNLLITILDGILSLG